MRHYRKPRRRDWIDALVRIAIYVVAMTVAFFVYWPAGFVVAAVGLVMLLSWRHKAVAYRCQHGGKRSRASALVVTED